MVARGGQKEEAMRSPQSRRGWLRLVAASLVTALSILTGTTTAAAGVAPPSPSTASTGPGSGIGAPVINATAISICAKVADKAGFSFAHMVNTPHGPVRKIVVAVAVAMAESSCNPNALNVNSNGCRDRGLWQIDDCAHP